MFGLFKNKPLLSEELRNWQFDTFAWLIKNSKKFGSFDKIVLVEPTDKFFPDKSPDRQKKAKMIFERVKVYARMSKWPTRLVEQEENVDPKVAPTVLLQDAPNSPAGTYNGKHSEAVITYDPDLINRPIQLIATFAHELAHYLTLSIPEFFSDNPKEYEFLADIGAVYLGFGIFQANSVINFNQFTSLGTQGWQTQRQGYLEEEEIIFALGIFTRLKDINPKQVMRHLKPSLSGYYKRALKDIDEYAEEIDRLKSLV